MWPWLKLSSHCISGILTEVLLGVWRLKGHLRNPYYPPPTRVWNGYRPNEQNHTPLAAICHCPNSSALGLKFPIVFKGINECDLSNRRHYLILKYDHSCQWNNGLNYISVHGWRPGNDKKKTLQALLFSSIVWVWPCFVWWYNGDIWWANADIGTGFGAWI